MRGYITEEFQEHAGVKDANTLSVSYAYDTSVTSSEFTAGYRPKSITYPDGRIVHVTYGSSGGVDDDLSRVNAIKDDNAGSPGGVFASYSYNGAGRLVRVDYEQPDVRMDHFGGTGGTYTGFDRFGRIADYRWRDYGASAYAARYGHGYDRNGNRLWREDLVGAGFDELYTYDDLNRLIDAERGTLNGTYDAITSATFAQDWSLDALGNWSGFNQDDDGNGTDDLVQSRTHNDANEISGISETTGPAWVDPAFDSAGNMTDGPKPGDETTEHQYVYDAWNRLVELQDSLGTTLWTYEYDGRGRRIVKTDKTGQSDVAYDVYYTSEWQAIEVRKDGDVDPLRQHVWGVRYVDALIVSFRDSDTDGTIDDTLYALQDANWNVTALTDAAGTVLERYAYAPYGHVTVLDADFTADADGASDYDHEVLFAGYVRDWESGLYHVRNRHYHPALGRWVQRDPTGYRDALTLYQYVISSPIVGYDSTGLNTETEPENAGSQGQPPAPIIWPPPQPAPDPDIPDEPPPVPDDAPGVPNPVPDGTPIEIQVSSSRPFTPCGKITISTPVSNCEASLEYEGIIPFTGCPAEEAIINNLMLGGQTICEFLTNQSSPPAGQQFVHELKCLDGKVCKNKIHINNTHDVEIDIRDFRFGGCIINGKIKFKVTTSGYIGECVDSQ